MWSELGIEGTQEDDEFERNVRENPDKLGLSMDVIEQLSSLVQKLVGIKTEREGVLRNIGKQVKPAHSDQITIQGARSLTYTDVTS